jgi:hypothetical protein
LRPPGTPSSPRCRWRSCRTLAGTALTSRLRTPCSSAPAPAAASSHRPATPPTSCGATPAVAAGPRGSAPSTGVASGRATTTRSLTDVPSSRPTPTGAATPRAAWVETGAAAQAARGLRSGRAPRASTAPSSSKTMSTTTPGWGATISSASSTTMPRTACSTCRLLTPCGTAARRGASAMPPPLPRARDAL